jgi:hypothetical protein
MIDLTQPLKSYNNNNIFGFLNPRYAAILILANVGATTESCPYKPGEYLPIIGDYQGGRGGSPWPPF